MGAGGTVATGVGALTTVPLTSNVPPVIRGNRTITVAPASRLPTVVPVQVVVRLGATGVQLNASTPAVVGKKTAGTPPTTVPAGPVAVTTKVPDAVRVQLPLASPTIEQVPPTTVVHRSGPPVGLGTFTFVGTTGTVGVAVGVTVCVGVAVKVRVAVGVAVGERVAVGVKVGVRVGVSVTTVPVGVATGAVAVAV